MNIKRINAFYYYTFSEYFINTIYLQTKQTNTIIFYHSVNEVKTTKVVKNNLSNKKITVSENVQSIKFEYNKVSPDNHINCH